MEIFRYKIIFLIFAVISLFSCSKTDSTKTFIKDSLNVSDTSIEDVNNKNINIEVPIDELVPYTFTEEQVNEVKNLSNAPFVISLRKALNDFLDRKYNSVYIENSALNESKGNLNLYSKDYYKSRFFVLIIDNDYETNSAKMEIIFKDKPDKIFTAAMYQSGNIYKLKSFQQSEEYKEKDIKLTLRLYENIFNLEDCSF